MARSFQDIQATMSTTTMVTRMENMLKKVDEMIESNNIYTVWIRLVIGKDDGIVFDTTSKSKDENLFMSLDYDKCGAGVANEFTFKVAFDLFDFGQTSAGQVEQLDELIYKALNIQAIENAEDFFYCKFQYGYNVTGDTQIVSPLYEGLITDIIPSVDYTNGKTSYTIKGSSIISKSHLKYEFDSIEETPWNAFDLILWNLWYYHGNEATVNDLYDKNYANNIGNHSEDWKAGRADKYNIDIPEDLQKSASNVAIGKQTDMTVFEYIELVLAQTYNMNAKSYVSDDDANHFGHYEIEDEGDFKPYYTYYITDSGGSGIPTIHFAYVGSSIEDAAMKELAEINFTFEWFNRNNNLVIGWNPEVNLKAYFLAKAQVSQAKAQIAEIDKQVEDYESIQSTAVSAHADWGTGSSYIMAEQKIKTLEEERSRLNEKLIAFSKSYEFYKASITLVGIPSDIPLNIVLSIKPKILESISRTQGKYYVLGSKDKINTNGLYTTKINLFRLKDIDKTPDTITKAIVTTAQNVGDSVVNSSGVKEFTGESMDGTAIDDFHRRNELLKNNGIAMG